MSPIIFNTSEVLASYTAIVRGKNDLYQTSVALALKPVDDVICFLKEKHRELERQLTTYEKRSPWPYSTDTSPEELFAPLPAHFRYRAVYCLASTILNDGVQIRARRDTISHSLSQLDELIQSLLKQNMALAERIRQKKSEMRTLSWKQQNEEEIRIILPKRPAIAAPAPSANISPAAQSPPPSACQVEHLPAKEPTHADVVLADSFDKNGESAR